MKKQQFPEITPESINKILKNAGSHADHLTITLLWNTDDDLDLGFDCIDDGKTINWGNKDGPNDCEATYDVEQGKPNYNIERGDGSFG